MIDKLKAAWALMQAGKVVSNPALWKTRQVTTTVIVAALWALVNVGKAFGVEIPVDAETIDAAAVAILGLGNLVLTVATTDKIGLSTKL